MSNNDYDKSRFFVIFLFLARESESQRKRGEESGQAGGRDEKRERLKGVSGKKGVKRVLAEVRVLSERLCPPTLSLIRCETRVSHSLKS